MTWNPKFRSPVQVASLCAGTALGGMLDEVREADRQTEWEARSCKQAYAHISELAANPPDLGVLPWRRCLFCNHNCALALHQSCPNLPLLLLGADPKSNKLPPQAALRLAAIVPKTTPGDEPEAGPLRWAMLHCAVCAGAGGADEALARAAVKPPVLRARLLDKWQYANDHDLDQAIEQAVLSHLKQPRCYDLTRGTSVLDFIYLLADRRLTNLARGEERRANKFESLDEMAERGNFEPAADSSPLELIIAAEDALERSAKLARRLAALEAFAKEHLPATDQAILRLMLSGERRTAPYAVVLGVGALPEAEQRAAVKRTKDRLLVRLKRWAAGTAAVTVGEPASPRAEREKASRIDGVAARGT